MAEKNLPQKVVAYGATFGMMVLFLIWLTFGHMDVPVEKTRFVSGFATCQTPGANNPTNAYGGPGDLVFDRFSPTRLFFAAFGFSIIVFLATPLIGQDSKALNDVAIIIVVLSAIVKAFIFVYLLFVWAPTYNKVGPGFVGNFLNDPRACCVAAIAASSETRCPNGAPNYPSPLPCTGGLASITIDELGMNDSAVLFIIIIILLLMLDLVLGGAAFLSKETNLASKLQDIVNNQFQVESNINKKR